ncbi:MAG TPA: ABC transporter ATP-binding protein [Isosphaeraceae bacterium]|nr:ABC transporter ATP-binding protein [Isosphaeraceae bacterium]
MIRVALEGLVKRYDQVAVVEGASLEIRPGELAYVVGPAGAGKTTLARLVAGLEPLDGGAISFDGRIIHTLPPRERKIGFVFQEDALWPRLTVAENVGYGLKVQGLARGERRDRVAEALNLVRVDSLAQKHPDQLTGPQRQRVALARALAGGPGLLILDEPMGRLDPRARDELRDEIRRVHDEVEVTTLALTRDAREALAMADRLAIMDLGRIVQAGPPHEVYNRPADAFVARLLGPANLLQGQVEGTDARGELVVRTPFGRLIGQTAAGALDQGTPVTIAIRPEALTLGPNVPIGSNRFPATIQRLVFLGEVRQVHLRGPGDWPVLALALQSQSHHLREGQSLTLSVPPEHVVVLLGKYAVPRG